MNQDDDSILDRLLNELDIDSALRRLRRIGFMLSPSANLRYHHLHRSKQDETEDIFIRINSQNHFRIKYVCQGLGATHSDTITSWDEWVAFVRQLIFKAPRKSEHAHREKEQDNEPYTTKDLKSTE